MAQLHIISPTEIRLVCDCGKYTHVIKKGEDGEFDYDTFLRKETPPEPTEDNEPKPKEKPRDFWGSVMEGKKKPKGGA